MQNILIKVLPEELSRKDRLDYDLYNEKGEIIYKKGQKIDSGFLLMLHYLKIFRKTSDLPVEDSKYDDIMTFIFELMLLGVKKQASYINLEPQSSAIQIVFEIDGVLQEGAKFDKSIYVAVVKKLKDLVSLAFDDKQVNKDGNITISLLNRLVDFVPHFANTSYGERVSIQVIDRDHLKIPELKELFFSSVNMENIERFIRVSQGIFIASGLNESGKTMTLYSLLKYLRRMKINIATIENKMIYNLPEINQTEINLENVQEFTDTLNKVLEQNPDIIYVEHINNEKIAEIVVQTALSGRLIYTSLYADSSVNALEKLLGMNLNSSDVAASVKGILSQRLVRKICDNCKTEYKISKEEMDKLFMWDGKQEIAFFKGHGCSKCNNTGYSGRVPIQEILYIEKDVKNIIANNVSFSNIESYIKQTAFQSMHYDGIKKVLRGFITKEEMDRVLSVH